MRASAILATVGLLSSGCATYGLSGFSRPHRHAFHFYGDDDVWPSSAADDRAALARAEATPTYVPEIPHREPIVTPADTVHEPFAQVKALAAIHALDLSPCAGRGAPPGYGHARVTFEKGGRVSAVAVDAPSGMSGGAVACVGEKLGSVTVTPFDGAGVTVGASYFMRAE